MTVYYLGNFLPLESTENHIAKTLRLMGHEVVEIQEDFMMPEHLAERLKTEEYDLFLFTRTWGNTLKNDHLDIIRARGIPSASYHLDLYVGLKRDGGLGSDPFWLTDFVFTPDGDPKSAKVFKKKGINHYYIKPAVFEEACFQFNAQPDKDIIFVGSYSYHPEWKYRQELIDWLKNHYREAFELWGSEGLGSVRGDELNILYARAKIAVGDSLCLPGHTYYWSDRVYECLGRGGFIIHPFIEGMQEEFTDKENIVFYEYGNWEQLAELIYYYLNHEEERVAIRNAGHEFVKNHATYRHRLQQALDIIEQTRAQKKSEELA
jgi:hypothetical protein